MSKNIVSVKYFC